jgi:methionyl-tRNA formyltransferase
VRIAFFGTPDAAVPSLDAFVSDGDTDVVAVVTNPDRPSGRGHKLQPPPVKVAAEAAGLPVWQPERPREILADLADLQVDACAVVAYGSLLPVDVLEAGGRGFVNLHFSLLPAWRGAAPVQAALRAGDELTGATTFLLEEGLDTGPTFGVVTEQVRPADTAGDLLGRLAESGAQLLVATLDGIEDGILEPRAQPADGVSHAPKVGVEDARIDWATPAVAVDRLVRSVTPEPGAWTTFRGQRLGLGPVTPLTGPDLPELKPGELHADKRRVLTGTATGPVRLGAVRAPGKREMPAPDWARGVRIESAELLS